MNIESIVTAMIAENGENIHVYRTFMATKYSSCVAKRFTEVIEKAPQCTDLVMLMAVYPALKWTMQCEDITSLMANVVDTDKPIRDLIAAQGLITSASGLKPKLMLAQRAKYFDACREVIKIIQQAVANMGKFPGEGILYKNALLKIMHEEQDEGKKGKDMSRYTINKYLPEALRILYDQCHKAIDPYIDIVLDGYTPDEDEITEQYHDIEALLLEYNKITWHFKSIGDKAVKLLHCGSVDEMLAVTEQDEQYYDAYLIAEYIKMISGAVEIVKRFPIYGERFYTILRPMLETPPQYTTLSDRASEVGMSPFLYSVNKRKALSVLGCALWGCDADTYVRLLTAPV